MSDDAKLYPNQVAKQPRRVKMFVAERGGAPYQRQVPKMHLTKKQRRAIRVERKNDTEKWLGEQQDEEVDFVINTGTSGKVLGELVKQPKEGTNGQD